MIISVSRRTDIPSFYSDWFFNRLKEGYVYVKNPFNRKQISKIKLNPHVVDCFVFWTKDPLPMMNRLKELKDYPYYFQFTITPYKRDIEVNMRKKKDIIDTFKELSTQIGKERVIWRYDPILINENYNKEYHYEWFQKFLEELSDYTKKCMISFIDPYKNTRKNAKSLKLVKLEERDLFQLGEKLANLGKKHNIAIETCSEAIDLSAYGIKRGKCIDENLISKIVGSNVYVNRDNNQRDFCGCMKSIDIGQYNTCIHNCLYCYANYNYREVNKNYKKHLEKSPLLVGKLIGDERITSREMKSIKEKTRTVQLKLNI
ncbi:MAG: DUF1848 domain-containing protein [Anaeromicrobium sp.]|jgi:hypothetical protein|uniref:DUF1848 domain-containing protein n=1 Tax=Anaeromicrobium sp. TaxID=1929132 RepID=UPI0025F3E32E|nr:DUF1848 domain-containing protein [Anaeromicrobium sp.]MCT4593469.1 DUF1848 domain-containing protein [Anaeromicrobium sp.]